MYESTSHAISNKSPGTYYYKVAACNGAGNTTCSAQSAASSGVVVNAAASETVTYLHSDTLGNVIGESQADGTFTRYHYKPYGERVESQPERLGFTGHLHQKELGLTYMQARHFDPLMGRFYGNDPVSFTPGNVFSFNRYGYGNNNPYRYTDPDGQNSVALRGSWWVGSRIGGAINYAVQATTGTTLGVLLYEAVHNDSEQSEDAGDDPYPENPDEWTPPEGWTETPAGAKTGGRNRQWVDESGRIRRRWDREGREGGKERGPHWHDHDDETGGKKHIEREPKPEPKPEPSHEK